MTAKVPPCLALAALLVAAPLTSTAGVGDVVGAMATKFNGTGVSRNNQQNVDLDDILQRVSQQMNRRMPEAIDSETRLDRVSAEPGPRFTFHYSLLGLRGSEVNRSEFARTIQSHLAQRLCDSSQVQTFFRHGVTVVYLYRSNDGQALGGIDFAPDSCDATHQAARKQAAEANPG